MEQAEKVTQIRTGTEENYQHLRKELMVLEVSIWLAELDSLRIKKEKLPADIRAVEAQLKALMSAMDELHAQEKIIDEKVKKTDIKREQAGPKLSALNERMIEQKAALSLLEREVANHQDCIISLQRELGCIATSGIGGEGRERWTQSDEVQRISFSQTKDIERTGWTVQVYQQIVNRYNAEINQKNTCINGLAEEIQKLHECMEVQEKEVQTLKNVCAAIQREKTGIQEKLLEKERLLSQLEQRMCACMMEERQILDRLWERYELSLSDAAPVRIELESKRSAHRRIRELKREFAALNIDPYDVIWQKI